MDSDIQWSYGKIIDKVTKKIFAPSYDPQWKEVDEQFYGKKSKK